MEIRILKIEDYNAYASIREHALKTFPSAFSATEEDEKIIRESRFNETMKHPFNFIMGAFEDNELLAMVGFVKNQGKKIKHKGFIWGVFVLPEKQGKGIAQKLMKATIDKAFEIEDLNLIQLGVSSNNESAIKLYEKLGFTNYGLEKNAIKVDEQFFDEFLMVKFR